MSTKKRRHAKRSKRKAIHRHPRRLRASLDELDRELLRLILAKPAITDVELGRLVGLNRNSVRIRRTHPLFADTLRTFQLDAIDLIKKFQTDAILQLSGIMRLDVPQKVLTDGTGILAAKTRAASTLAAGAIEQVKEGGVGGVDAERIAREFAKALSSAGTGYPTPSDNGLSDGTTKIQNSARGTKGIQDGDRKESTDH